jgi:hypothetical protein
MSYTAAVRAGQSQVDSGFGNGHTAFFHFVQVLSRLQSSCLDLFPIAFERYRVRLYGLSLQFYPVIRSLGIEHHMWIEISFV